MIVHAGKHGPTARFVVNMANAEEMLSYSRSLDDVRFAIRGINESLEDEEITEDEYKVLLKSKWLPMVDKLSNDYSIDLITFDIRWARNDVEELVGLEKTNWPPRKVINDDGTAVVESSSS